MIDLKTEKEMEIMIEGGRILAGVKKKLAEKVGVGVSGKEIDRLARGLIIKAGAEPSFEKEPGYRWATCIDINDGVVHGIPTDYRFREGDVVGVDAGLLYGGFHSDVTVAVGVGKVSSECGKMLEVGRQALNRAIAAVKVGRRIIDISREIEETIRGAGYSPVTALCGHGVGRELHEDPLIPCVVVESREESPVIAVGMGLAIEVIYTAGSGEVAYGGQMGEDGKRARVNRDGWTIVSLDGKMAVAFEETVVVTGREVVVTTRG